MAQVINGGDAAFNYLLYGEPDRGFQQHLQQYQDQVMGVLGDAGRLFAEKSQAVYERFNNSEAMRLARAAARKVTHMFNEDAIYKLGSIGDLQQAPRRMVPYLMAEPTVRAMYHKQQVEGYGDHYIDYQPGVVGEEHLDYQAVMDGLFVDDPNDPDACVATTYLHLEDEQLLHHDEQVDILLSWGEIRAQLKAGKSDPTSRFNASLG